MNSVNQKQLDQLVPIIQKQVKELQNAGGWQTIADGKVKGYKKKSNSDSVITKAQTIINIALQKVVDFFMKDGSIEKLNEMMIQNKLVHQKKGKYKIFHVVIKTPFPFDNRQQVTMTTWINQGNKFYLGAKSCNYPIEANPKYVMACMNIAGWVFQKVDNNSTKVTNFADLDPRGNIPDVMKNLVAEKRIQTLKDLQGILKKQGY